MSSSCGTVRRPQGHVRTQTKSRQMASSYTVSRAKKWLRKKSFFRKMKKKSPPPTKKLKRAESALLKSLCRLEGGVGTGAEFSHSQEKLDFFWPKFVPKWPSLSTYVYNFAIFDWNRLVFDIDFVFFRVFFNQNPAKNKLKMTKTAKNYQKVDQIRTLMTKIRPKISSNSTKKWPKSNLKKAKI